jgi:putative endonuclease
MRHDIQGTVYLLHFLEPIGNPANPHAMAQHHLGWALVAADRISTQTAGNGAAIVRAVQAKGIGFLVAATWPGTRSLERRLKNRKCAPRYCPICGKLAAAGVAELAGEGGVPVRPSRNHSGAPPAGGQRDETPRPDYPVIVRPTRPPVSPGAAASPTHHKAAGSPTRTHNGGAGQGSALPLRCRAGTPARLRRPRTARPICWQDGG